MTTPPPMRMRSNYYNERDYLKTNVRTGVTRNRAGTRLLSLTSDFLIGLRNALVFECGKAAGAVFKAAGRKWGSRFAARMEKELTEYYGRPLAECPWAMFEACLVEAFSHHGFGKLRVDLSQHEKGLIICTIENPVYAELTETGGQPADPMLAGTLAGVFSHYCGRELDCAQTQCQANGAPDSRFVVTLAARLESVEDWLKDRRSHLEILAGLAQTRAEAA